MEKLFKRQELHLIELALTVSPPILVVAWDFIAGGKKVELMYHAMKTYGQFQVLLVWQRSSGSKLSDDQKNLWQLNDVCFRS
jgi:hypothetical protein